MDWFIWIEIMAVISVSAAVLFITWMEATRK